MRVQIFSDIHLDYPGSLGVPARVPGANLIVSAGDLCQGLVVAVETLRRAFPSTEIVMVAGNHEFWVRRTYSEELEAARERARELGVHLLENDTALVGPLRLIGATGWTDYDLFGPSLREAAMRAAAETMLDHRRIKWCKQPWLRFRPQEARSLHLASRRFIETELAKPHLGPSMVVTHHPGSIEAVAPAHRQSILTAAYASTLEPIMDFRRFGWWVSGHTHKTLNLRRAGIRFVSNPAGYGDENPYFDPAFAIEAHHE